jgi:hypothetical protein
MTPSYQKEENKGERNLIYFLMMNCERLQAFRQATYELLSRAKDATFELMDAVMTTRQASSLAEFSLSPLFSGVAN